MTVVEGDAAPSLNDTVVVSANGMSRGRDDAPVTMVEFLDYECPYCQRFHLETLPKLLDEYVETGKLRIVVRDKPLPMHENVIAAARRPPGTTRPSSPTPQQQPTWALPEHQPSSSDRRNPTDLFAAA